MLFVRPPAENELKELKRLARQESGRISQRAQMILLSVQRRTVPEIATIFGTTAATVRFWIRWFDRWGPSGLYDEERSGRPRRAIAAVQSTLAQLIQDDPQRAGYLATFWTVVMLTLQHLGLPWGRPRLGMPQKTDPEIAAKQWAIAQAVIEAGTTATVLHADESRLHLLPLVRAMWH